MLLQAKASQLLHLDERPIIERDGSVGRRRELTHSFVPSEVIFGRDDARSDIVKLLIDSNGEDQALSIIPIVGIGGLGKTALAQCVFNDDIVKNHFEVKLWACVTDMFDLRSIVRQLIAGGLDREVGNLEIEQLQTQLRRKIDGTKYLLILDDLWTETHEEWLKLKSLLMAGAKGSKILITTRLSIVAKMTGTVREPYALVIGDECFMGLVRRNFFQDLRKDWLGNVKSRKMHDLMHDVAKSVAGKESALINDCKSLKDIVETILHMSYDTATELPEVFRILSNAKKLKLRTFLAAGDIWSVALANMQMCPKFFSRFQCLRHLDLQNADIKVLPKSICKLKHLRQLDLSLNPIQKLPKSLVKLVNLQTLKLSGCVKLQELPKDINRLVNLRCLDIEFCRALKYMPDGIGGLSSLRSLPLYVLGKDVPPSKYWTQLIELRGLNSLRGRLEISNLASPEIDFFMKRNQAILQGMHMLESLWLSFLLEREPNSTENADEILLEELQPHTNLSSLSILQYTGRNFPNWMKDALLLPNLVELSLDRCLNLDHLPYLHHFPSLKCLGVGWCIELDLSMDDNGNEMKLHGLENLREVEIKGIPKLVSLPNWLSHLTDLQQLNISYCENLVGLPEWIGHVGSLRKLRLIECPNLETVSEEMSRLNSLHSLIIIKCPGVEQTKIEHISCNKWP